MHSLAELDWKCKLRDHRNWKQCAYIFSINAASGPNPAQNLRTWNEIRNLWHQIVFRGNDTFYSTNGMYQETLHLRLACQQRLRDTNISALSVSRWIFYIFFQLLGACRAGKFPGTAGTTTFVKGFWSQKNANKNHWEKHQTLGCLGWSLTAGRTWSTIITPKNSAHEPLLAVQCTSRKILSYKSYGKGAVSIAGPSIHFCFCHAKPGRSMGVNCSCAEEPPIQGAAQAATWFLLLPQNDMKFQCQIVRLLACSWHFPTLVEQQRMFLRYGTPSCFSNLYNT